MSGNPHWHVDIDLYCDDEVTFARARLTAHHTVMLGRGAARSSPAVSSSDPMVGDAGAVAAALHDLGDRLVARMHARTGTDSLP